MLNLSHRDVTRDSSLSALHCLSRLGLVVTLIASVGLSGPVSAEEKPTAADSPVHERAGNAEVEKVIREFKGKGAIGDGTDPLTPEEALKHFEMADGLKIETVASEPEVAQPLYISFDPKGRMWVLQYLQYPFPAGLKIIRYDQYLRAVFDDVPRPPPHHVKGKDKVTVFEDTNGDGKYDKSRDAITGLNIASAALVGHGGIWVTNPPYLLFYPDADEDGVPDGDPQVKLRGFGLEDTHSIANSIKWGPDGWLYGANGSTTTATISSKVTKNVHYEGQNIWRFNPDNDVFEIYAEGGGNTFSLEIDSRGRVFSGTNHGNTRGMYYPQGSYGEKSFGKHGPLTNPFAFGYFHHMKHVGDKDRFPQTFVIYEGGTLPKKYDHTVIAANSLHNRVWGSKLMRDGSTYQTEDMPNLAFSDDTWFRPVDVKVGPDGAVYLADWYDSRLSHVDPKDTWHKTSGRIYRIQGEGVKDQAPVDFTKLTNDELIKRFSHPNKWHQQTALRVLGDRLKAKPDEAATTGTLSELRKLVHEDRPEALLALWTLHLAKHLDETQLSTLLSHPQADIRRWSVRLLGDARNVSESTGKTLAAMTVKEPDVQVRSQLASSAARFSTTVALPILRALIGHDEDLEDPHLPLLIWWGLEAHCSTHPLFTSPHVNMPLNVDPATNPRQQVLEFFQDQALWTRPIVQQTLAERLMRRFALEGIQDQKRDQSATAAFSACEKLLQQAPESIQPILMTGFLESYTGRKIETLPAGLKQAIQDYQESLGKSDLVLGVRLGQKKAIAAALKVIRDEKADLGKRLTLIRTFGEVDVPASANVLAGLLYSPSTGIKKAALQALMKYSDPKIGQRICSAIQRSLTDELGLREAAFRVLASRDTWASQLLTEIEEHRIVATSVPHAVVQQIRLHPDPELQKRADKIWGKTRETGAEKVAEIARVRKLLTQGEAQQTSSAAQLAKGHELFKKNCATCHTLFSEGGQAGPNLTGYERSNLNFMLLSIIDPSAGIREEYTQFQIATVDGRVLTGLITDRNQTTVTIRGANNQTTTLPQEDIDVMQAMSTSLMPDGLLKKLSNEEIVDLFRYLMQPTPAQAAQK